MIKSKKINIIVTSIILAVALLVAIVTGIEFNSFRNYETEFIVREDVIDDVISYSEYSPNLAGTAGDANFYAIYGTENTVAVVKKDRAAEFATEIPATAKVVYVKGETAQLEAAKANLSVPETNYIEKQSIGAAAAAVLDPNSDVDVAIMRYQDVKDLYNAGWKTNGLVVAGAEVEKVPSILVLGGTHPNEPSGQLTATIFLENAVVERGKLYVVVENNKSAYTHSQPQEASPFYYEFEVEGTTRKFKYGSRATNTVDQWPTPDVYAHSSGQKLSSTEVRNLNRAYPGSPTGTYSEQIAWAVTNFVITNDITIVIDLHEASPEYGVNNAMVFHEDAEAIKGEMDLEGFTGIRESESLGSSSQAIKLNPSAKRLRGLTHRELGDFTNAYVFLFETSNASQGKLHGAFVPELITCDGYRDKFYAYAWKQTLKYNITGGYLGNKMLEAPAASIDERVARHTDSILSVINAFNAVYPSGPNAGQPKFQKTRSSWSEEFHTDFLGEDFVKESVFVGEFRMSGIPSYEQIFTQGVESFLLPSQR